MERRYTLSNFISALKNPSKLLYEPEYLLSKYLFQLKYGGGIDVMDRDWDNLIILDACRADYFSEYNDIDGDTRTVVSHGTTSSEFIDANFAGRELHDTIYVTANPFVERLSDDVFFKVYYSELFEKWDRSLKTIPPEALVEATVRMHERYPNKRLITHFMQPHVPYIGPFGRELSERYEFGVFNPGLKDADDFDVPEVSISQAVTDGAIGEDELKRAYGENVQIAIEHAEELIDRIDGKSVITADHGEMLGERVLVTKRYEHANAHTRELRVVPWHVVDGDRREIREGDPTEFSRLDEDLRESRLKALGYA